MTADDIYKKALSDIWNHGIDVKPREFLCKELLAYKMIFKPHDNIITLKGFETNLEYAKEELKWYYSASNKIDFSPLICKTWSKFSDDGNTVNSAYGYRIFGKNEKTCGISQWDWAVNKLLEDKDSRQALININMVSDKLKPTLDFVCTIALQMFIRNNRLHWITMMRSQDIFYGTRNDIYCFSEMQKKMASELRMECGDYIHFCSSLHLYERHFDKVKNMLHI